MCFGSFSSNDAGRHEQTCAVNVMQVLLADEGQQPSAAQAGLVRDAELAAQATAAEKPQGGGTATQVKVGSFRRQ